MISVIYADGSVDAAKKNLGNDSIYVYSARGAEYYLARVSVLTINNYCAHLAANGAG